MLFIPLLVAVSIADAQGEKNRLPKPGSESVKRAVKDIREAYAEDYSDAEQGTRNKHKLALKLNAAAEEENDGAVQFALLKEAIRLLSDAQQVEDLISTTEMMAGRFKIDELKIKVYFLKKIASETKTKSSDRMTVDAMQRVVDQAIAQDQYDKALELLSAVSSMGERTKDRKLVREYETIMETTQREAEQFQFVQDAQQILDEKPLDPAANRTVGEWYCLKKNRWEEGVTYLALGDQSEMKAISRLDLKLEKSSDDLLQLGDLCWELAEQRPGDRDALKTRAVFWYRAVQPVLNGVAAKKTSNRIASWQAESGTVGANDQQVEQKGQKESQGEEDEEKPLLAKRPKPLSKVKPKKSDAPKNLAGQILWSSKGRVVLKAGQAPIQIPGKNNLYLHPYRRPGRSALVYNLDGRYRSFTGGVGVPDIPGVKRPESEITFSVIRDGEETEILKTARRGRQSFEPFAFDVTGVKKLVLTTQCDGNFLGCFAFWFNPILSPEEVKPLERPSRESRDD